MLKGLKDFRQTAGLSKVGMANLLKVSLSYYEKVESGQRQPSHNFINRFSIQFPDTDIASIFFKSNRHISCKSDNINSDE